MTPRASARGLCEEHLHLGVPALDAVFEIDGEDADVDRFDDVLVEILQALELVDLGFEPAVELRVLDGRCRYIPRATRALPCLQTRGSRPALVRPRPITATVRVSPPEPVLVGDPAGKIVVQVQPGGRFSRCSPAKAQHLLRVLKKTRAWAPPAASKVEEAKVHRHIEQRLLNTSPSPCEAASGKARTRGHAGRFGFGREKDGPRG